MTGNNSLTLNEATMIEIVQYWFDNKAWNPNESSPKVGNVKYDGLTSSFIILTSSKEDERK